MNIRTERNENAITQRREIERKPQNSANFQLEPELVHTCNNLKTGEAEAGGS